MFRRLLGVLGLGVVTACSPAASTQFEPYAASSPANAIYNLLFCDDLSAFQPAKDDKPTDWQVVLFGSAQDPAQVSALAQDESAESRIRALAFNWLRAHGRPVPKGEVLGVVIEFPLDQGLDVLAAFADGSVRYINQSGKMAVVEPGGLPSANSQAKQLLALAGPVVGQIGPWDKPRLPPPARPDIRLTFVVSDGLYFGQGPFSVMEQDPLAAPLIQKGTELVQTITERTLARQTP